MSCAHDGAPNEGSKLVIRPGDKIVQLGDSITDFDNINSFASMRSNVDLFYTSRGLTAPTWVDEGVTGDTTQGVINRITDITTHAADVVTVYIGVNDVQAAVATSTIETNLNSILDSILTAKPTTRILMIPPWLIFGVKPNGSNASDTAMNAAMGVVRDIAATRSLPFVDIRTSYFATSAASLLSDSVHPNAAGKLWISGQVEFRLILRTS